MAHELPTPEQLAKALKVMDLGKVLQDAIRPAVDAVIQKRLGELERRVAALEKASR